MALGIDWKSVILTTPNSLLSFCSILNTIVLMALMVTHCYFLLYNSITTELHHENINSVRCLFIS